MMRNFTNRDRLFFLNMLHLCRFLNLLNILYRNFGRLRFLSRLLGFCLFFLRLFFLRLLFLRLLFLRLFFLWLVMRFLLLFFNLLGFRLMGLLSFWSVCLMCFVLMSLLSFWNMSLMFFVLMSLLNFMSIRFNLMLHRLPLSRFLCRFVSR